MIRHLYMDERLANQKELEPLRATALTAILINPADHSEFRHLYYSLLSQVFQAESGKIPYIPPIHAMNLFPDGTDEQRTKFLSGLADIAISQRVSLYRIGYRKNRHLGANRDERDVLGLCWMSLQWCIQDDEPDAVIWPIMELDRSYNRQDLHFASTSGKLDWLTYNMGAESMSVDNQRFGEVLYHTKHSIYGVMTDCFSYLLHVRFRREIGEHLSPFKTRLAEISDKLSPITRRNEIIDLKVGKTS